MEDRFLPPNVKRIDTRLQVTPDRAIDITQFEPVNGELKGLIIHTHGYGTNKENLATLLAMFAHDGFRAISYSVQGHSGSDGIYDFRSRSMLDDFEAIVARYRVKNKPVLASGHSFGNNIALRAAYEQSIDGVIAISAIYNLTEFMGEMRWIKYYNILSYNPTQIETDKNLLKNPEVQRYNPARFVGNITIPMIIVHGENDGVVPVENAYQLKKAQPNASLVIIKGGGHGLPAQPVYEQIAIWLNNNSLVNYKYTTPNLMNFYPKTFMYIPMVFFSLLFISYWDSKQYFIREQQKKQQEEKNKTLNGKNQKLKHLSYYMLGKYFVLFLYLKNILLTTRLITTWLLAFVDYLVLFLIYYQSKRKKIPKLKEFKEYCLNKLNFMRNYPLKVTVTLTMGYVILFLFFTTTLLFYLPRKMILPTIPLALTTSTLRLIPLTILFGTGEVLFFRNFLDGTRFVDRHMYRTAIISGILISKVLPIILLIPTLDIVAISYFLVLTVLFTDVVFTMRTRLLSIATYTVLVLVIHYMSASYLFLLV